MPDLGRSTPSEARTKAELPGGCQLLPGALGRTLHRTYRHRSEFSRPTLRFSPRQTDFIRRHIPSQYADDLFGTAHMLRIDPEDDIWTLPSELNFLAF